MNMPLYISNSESVKISEEMKVLSECRSTSWTKRIVSGWKVPFVETRKGNNVRWGLFSRRSSYVFFFLVRADSRLLHDTETSPTYVEEPTKSKKSGPPFCLSGRGRSLGLRTDAMEYLENVLWRMLLIFSWRK